MNLAKHKATHIHPDQLYFPESFTADVLSVNLKSFESVVR